MQTWNSDSNGGIWDTLVLGLKVLGWELKWQALRGVRALELRQLEKRLREEYAALGSALADQITLPGEGADKDAPLPAPDEKTALALKQIRFLREEIEHLRRERSEMRKEFLERRQRSLNKPLAQEGPAEE
jgi:hypothetical protein